MFNIGYFKSQPTEFIIKYVAGKIDREGQGLSFFYLRYNTQVVAVPTSSTDANLVFNEVTNNFQSVTIQGQFTYRIRDPKRAAELLNFSMNPSTHTYLSNDPDRLAQRITNIIQMETRGELQKRSLEEALGQYEIIAANVLRRVNESNLLQPLGVELLSVYFVAAKPTPEVAKALEAEYRETLLRKADEAISARRAAAVEEERKIKENELNTEIALEERRRQLIDLQGANELREAENRGRAFELEAEFKTRAKAGELAVYQSLEPRAILALAMNEFGQKAENISNLTITTEMLSSLLNGTSSNGRGE